MRSLDARWLVLACLAAACGEAPLATRLTSNPVSSPVDVGVLVDADEDDAVGAEDAALEAAGGEADSEDAAGQPGQDVEPDLDAEAATDAPSPDAPADAEPIAAGPGDSEPVDSGPVDSGPADSGPADTGPADVGDPCLLIANLCGDGNVCTTDTCQPGGNCKWTAVDSPCDDGNACTVGDTCQKGQCMSGAAQSCDDGEACTADACLGGTCSHGAVANGSPCALGSCAGGKCAPSTPASCAAVLQATPAAKSGVYLVDPDGSAGAEPPLQAWCEMALGGGGWTLLAVQSDDKKATWTWAKRKFWSTDTTTFGSLQALNQDYKSKLLHTLPMQQLLFVHAPSNVWVQYGAVADGKTSLAAVITAVGDKKCYPLKGGGIPPIAGTLKVGGKLCDANLYFNPADHDNVGYKCGVDSTPEDTFGPAWNVYREEGCFDDPGWAGGLGPVASEPYSEYNNIGFGWALNLPYGTPGSGANRMAVFAR